MLVENVAFNYKSMPLKTVNNTRMNPEFSWNLENSLLRYFDRDLQIGGIEENAIYVKVQNKVLGTDTKILHTLPYLILEGEGIVTTGPVGKICVNLYS